MGDPPHFGFGGGGGADGQAAVNLHGVAGNNLAVQLQSQLHGQSGLAGGGRSHDADDSIQALTPSELPLQLAFCQRQAHWPAVGAVFDIIPAQRLRDQLIPFAGVGAPARLNGGFACDGMEQTVPQSLRTGPLSFQELSGQLL